jgi:tetratricopeptide (TPR) repeat protein/predicted Ser/Thr protein kinase
MPNQDADEAMDGTPAELREVRPAVCRVRMEEARARAERALFRAAEPARVGRFVLLDTIATGGMGVVYRAYDPQLDRKVALKLIHPRASDTRQAHERLIAEARALAQLKHPHVVPVHDVLLVDDQVVVVMELVEGGTLAAWERAQQRTWRQIVAVYVAAGRGLAAAHALGVVHRDFKPANVIVGDDGRVRVLDFGLARVVTAEAGEAVGDPAAPPAASGGGLTGTGDIVGTPAYMAPEQLAGGSASEASDQFSFCVALYHALFAVRPFIGDSVESFLTAIRAGRIAAPDVRRAVPGWLRALVVRGLAAEPAARRWRFVALAATVAVAATVSVAIVAGRRVSDPLAACDGGSAEIDAAWSPTRRAAVRAAFAAIDTPYAHDVVERVVGGLDAYRADWTRMHREACVAHRRGAQSSALFDRRVVCLQRRKGDLSTGADVLAQVDRDSVERAVDVVAGLPPVAWCADLEALEAASDPPVTEAARDQVAALRLRLSRADALDRAGRAAEALDVAAAALTDAQTLGYPLTVIEAALIKGRLLLLRRDFTAAVAPLALAESLALEHRQLAAAVVASARRLYVEGMLSDDLVGLRRQVALLEPLSRGITGDHFARPLLLNNIGVVYQASGDRETARRYFEAASAELASVAAPDPELTCIDANLAMVTADPAVRVTLARNVWERLRDQLGAQHPSTIAALDVYTHYVADPAVALRLYDEACELYGRFHPERLQSRAECEYRRAFLTAEVGDAAAAAARYAEVAVLARGSTDRDVVSWSDLAAGNAGLSRGDARDALRHFAALIATFSNDTFADRLRAAGGHLGAGIAERALGHDREAIAQLEIAVVQFTEATALTEDVENHRQLALARTTLAAALRARGGAGDRPRSLDAAAAAFYRASGSAAYRWRLEQISP